MPSAKLDFPVTCTYNFTNIIHLLPSAQDFFFFGILPQINFENIVLNGETAPDKEFLLLPQ